MTAIQVSQHVTLKVTASAVDK